jgi:DNA-binding CsgD family transcriptional regulator
MFRNFTLYPLGISKATQHSDQPTKKFPIQIKQLNLTNKKFEKLTNNKQNFQRYYLGEKYPNIYFTHQEATCMLYMMQGLNYKQIAQVISLSPRTIGFYCMNMRGKLRCKTKGELVKLIKQTSFMSFISEKLQD